MTVPRSRFLLALPFSAALVALAPGCSSNNDAVAQVGMVWTVQVASDSDSSTCPVNGSDTFTIGGGNPNDSTVATGGTVNGVPISVDCKVSGSASAGYDVFLQAKYGSLGTLTVGDAHIGGTTDPQTIVAVFNDHLPKGIIANLSQAACNLTYPSSNNGIAPGRIWAHLDCPDAVDGTTYKCDASADIRFENCAQ